MGVSTKIEWTESSWTPIRAINRRTRRPGWICVHASDGCRFCYAEAINKRLGTGIDFAAQNREAVDVYLDEKTLIQPLHWKRPRRIFPCSMTDLFGDWVPDEMLDRIFAVMALCPQHTFQVLTKRQERMRNYVTDMSQARRDGRGTAINTLAPACQPLECFRWPLPNVWLGVSCEDQPRWDERVPVLAQTQAALRWVSIEPQSERIDAHFDMMMPQGPRWIVVGGESGPGARPFDIEWARSIVAQCRAAGVACFVKQLGAWPVQVIDGVMDRARAAVDGPPRYIRASKGGDSTEWPEDLRVREYPA